MIVLLRRGVHRSNFFSFLMAHWKQGSDRAIAQHRVRRWTVLKYDGLCCKTVLNRDGSGAKGHSSERVLGVLMGCCVRKSECVRR